MWYEKTMHDVVLHDYIRDITTRASNDKRANSAELLGAHLAHNYTKTCAKWLKDIKSQNKETAIFLRILDFIERDKKPSS